MLHKGTAKDVNKVWQNIHHNIYIVNLLLDKDISWNNSVIYIVEFSENLSTLYFMYE